MNERYFFRGKRIDNGEWAIGSLAQTKNYPYDGSAICSYIWKIPCVDTLVEVDTATVGQSTGLRDVSGKLIYEGDIVRGRIGGTEQMYPWKVTVPEIYVHIRDKDSYTRVDLGSLRIVGNAYDNPELIEVPK